MDISQAIEILGEKRVIRDRIVVSIWNRIISEKRTLQFSFPVSVDKNPDISFSEKDLTDVKKDENWILVYNPGLSLVDSFAALGNNKLFKPYFGKGASRWLVKKTEEWALKRFKSRYNLIRAKAVYPNRSVKEQEMLIGNGFTRVSAQTLVNAYVVSWGAWGDSPLDKYSHFGTEKDDDCMRMVLTFHKGCIYISQWPYWGRAARLGAYVAL